MARVWLGHEVGKSALRRAPPAAGLVSAPSGRGGLAALLESHILGEIIVQAAFAFEAPIDPLGVITARKRPGQESLLRRPGSIGLWPPVTAWHGVVEPTVRGALVDVDLVTLMVGFETVAQPLHVVDRDDVVGFAEGREDRTGKR